MHCIVDPEPPRGYREERLFVFMFAFAILNKCAA